jgi:hypothetical protein
MRNAHDPDTALALIDSGFLLGIACPVCRNRVIFPLEKIAYDPRPVWRLPFRFSGCGEKKVWKWVLDESEIEEFKAGGKPRGDHGHHTTWKR